jgi:hypothetical protein
LGNRLRCSSSHASTPQGRMVVLLARAGGALVSTAKALARLAGSLKTMWANIV